MAHVADDALVAPAADRVLVNPEGPGSSPHTDVLRFIRHGVTFASRPADTRDMTLLTGIVLALLVCAALCFAVAAFSSRQPKINMLALGLLFFTLVPIVQVVHRVAVT